MDWERSRGEEERKSRIGNDGGVGGIREKACLARVGEEMEAVRRANRQGRI